MNPQNYIGVSRIFCFICLVLLLVSCGGGGGGSTANANKITPECFQGGSVPELEIGSGFANADWNDPHVLKVGAEYWMYASSNLGLFVSPSPVQIYRFTSTDATNWTLNPATPVLAVTAAQWDEGGNETPGVVFFAGEYHMFWTGYPDAWPNNDPANFRIGHATSIDGITWTKDASNLLGPSGIAGNFDEFIVAEPGPVVFNNTLYLYFTAIGVDAALATTLQVIGVITSTDGVTWSAPTMVLKPDQTVYPRAAYWIGYSTPNAVVVDGEMHLFVDVANDHGNDTWTQEALHHAYSADGLTNWTQDSTPIRRLTDFVWTLREIRSPAALLDGTILRLYFAGDDLFRTGEWGIGQMTCSVAP